MSDQFITLSESIRVCCVCLLNYFFFLLHLISIVRSQNSSFQQSQPQLFLLDDHKPELLFSIILFKPKFGLSTQGLHTHPKQEKEFSHGRADDAGPVPSLLDNSSSSCSRNSSSSSCSTSPVVVVFLIRQQSIPPPFLISQQ